MKAALATLFAVSCLSWTAWCEEQRVAILQSDDELSRAISLALAPWGLETVWSGAALPAQSEPEATREAGLLARRLGVRAVVWITRVDDGSLLWVFDVSSADVTTRRLTQTPPFDSASAAAVALSVKTALRASPIAPASERYGALDPATRSRNLGVEGGAGAAWVGERALDPRGNLAATVWFAVQRRLGLSLELSTGPGVSIVDAAYQGRYREVSVGGSARLALLQAEHFELGLALGGSAHFASLRGTLSEGSLDRSVDRVNGALDLRTDCNFYVGSRVYLGVAAGGAYFPRYRRYLVADQPVFAPFPVVANLSAHTGVELF